MKKMVSMALSEQLRQTSLQVLVGAELFEACGPNDSPELKGIKTLLMCKCLYLKDQMTALN